MLFVLIPKKTENYVNLFFVKSTYVSKEAIIVNYPI